MVRYKPYEEQQLEALLPALKGGMDPATAYSIFSGLQSGAVDRAAQQRAQRLAMAQEAMAAMQGQAQAGVPRSGLEQLLGSYQSAFPGLNRPRMDQRLEGSLDALVQGGPNAVSDLYIPPMPEPGALMAAQVKSLSMEPESVMGISDEATALATGAESGTPVPLHEARLRIMTKLRAMGYPESALNEAYDLIGQVYNSTIQAGGGARAGLINAPLTSLLRTSGMQDVGGRAKVGIR